MHLLEKFKAQRVSLLSRELISCCDSAIASSDAGHVYQLLFNTTGSNLSYKVGDSLGVFPKNPVHVVEKILECLSYSPKQLIQSRASSQISLYDFLRCHTNVNKLPPKLKSFFPDLEETMTFYDAIQKYKPHIPVELFVESVLPLLPRFYSIASAPHHNENQIELLVRLVNYSGEYEQRYGVCSFFLCKELELGKSCNVFVQPTKHFTITDDIQNKPIVMIGSGTGIAPYKAFVQQRIYNNDAGMNMLFFGERFEKANFYYQDFWKKAVENEFLKLFLAFSRDGDHKLYVQDLLKQQADLVLQAYEEGAYFFVCGSKVLGNEIKKTLEDILGKNKLSQLKEEHRYVADVY
ncbi:ferredoxin reductase domain-containing protein [Chlamydia psittaci]|uniref:sulfite reductase flavoprotein subunit alpha n=1 Tax=Chlamydia psittaci TaxID=83554 RepID=UPI00027E18AD|nr:sulfite reductase flavoprotein subunit alpha [Chlamydia psittaci]AFS21211.1 oxidoreductase NAD-binding domain protein [Chlamydia psittaci MN]KPZ37268.1 oxidoreductase [Chlamydia psittaci CP3]KPZ39267.1 oxidoreductase [Chlamydia psittaci str. Frances]MBE3635858.1 sulfite reductase flavoprotein subunit alpha [Chlamydia psittaci]CCO01716.1 putative oxidoreductase [Chlamydia psittaci 01DC12]